MEHGRLSEQWLLRSREVFVKSQNTSRFQFEGMRFQGKFPNRNFLGLLTEFEGFLTVSEVIARRLYLPGFKILDLPPRHPSHSRPKLSSREKSHKKAGDCK